jgi:myosin-5
VCSSDLSSLEEDSVRNALRARFESNHIYTNINSLLVAMNPYQQLTLYGSNMLEAYNTYGQASPGPHVYGVASATYRGLWTHAHSQSSSLGNQAQARLRQQSASCNFSHMQQLKDRARQTRAWRTA